MTINSKHYAQKKKFVEKLGDALRIAKPHLVSCEYKLGEELPPEKRWQEFIEMGEVVSRQVTEQPVGEFVIVKCANGHIYKIDVTWNSLAAIGQEVFTQMVCK